MYSKARSTGREPDSLAKLFIGGLASTTDEDSLKGFYAQWGGEILDIVVMRDPETKRSRGFGFVTFATEDQVDTVMSNRPHVINGKQVDPKRAVPREFQGKAEAQVASKRVYVGGVKPEHTEEVLREYFSQYGTVTEVDVVEDKKTGQKRGFAFILFDDHDPADKVVLMKYHTINDKKCECKKALSREELAKVQSQGDAMARGARTRGGGAGAGGRGGYQSYNNGASANGHGGPRYGGGGDWNASYNQGAAPPYGNQYNAGPPQWGNQQPPMANPYGQQNQYQGQAPAAPYNNGYNQQPAGYGGNGYGAPPAPAAGAYGAANPAGYGQPAQQAPGGGYNAPGSNVPPPPNPAAAAGGYGNPSGYNAAPAAAYGAGAPNMGPGGAYAQQSQSAKQEGFAAGGQENYGQAGGYGGNAQQGGGQPQGWRNTGSWGTGVSR